MCNNIRINFQKYCRKAGIITDEKLTTHTLRKSYAQTMSSHVDIWTLKKLMGHSSVRVLEQYYLHKTTPNEQQACDVMEGLFQD